MRELTKTKPMSRRAFLRNSSVLASVTAAQAALPAWMPRLAFTPAQSSPRGDVLVCVFLRGGADALNMIVPHGEDAYYAARPRLAIPRPDAAGSDPKTVDLDGFFGLHPSLSPLLPIFQSGGLTAVHATGSPHETRSHFEAMDFMERGTPGEYALTTGWIGRHLATLETDNESPVRAVGWGTAVQTALRGSISPVAIQSIVDYHLGGDERRAAEMLASLNALYALDSESLYASAQATQSALDVIASVGYTSYRPDNGATYPETDFAQALRQTAALIRAEVGLEAACVDLGGWDTHVNQGGAEGTQAQLLADLATGLVAFHQDLGTMMNRVSVVVMSEFGRRLAENGGRGTDHGHGGALLVMSDHLNAGPVYANWPGLQPDVLDRGEDLAITTDYRDVLTELLALRLNNPTVVDVFPDFTARSLSLLRA
ncbi:MAG: DUF1501 domain-containing protein [Chloroflexi bacterium]|nr:DUF1501 domain-containing protein [Chloroflexota bacterium]